MISKIHILALTLLATACAGSRPPVPPGQIPAAKPVAIADDQYGHTVFTSLTQEFELDYDHPRYDEVIDTVDKLTKGIGADQQQWNVSVFKHDSFKNAAATRGNRIFIWTPMIDATQSQGELAAILSHEIAHVLAGHTDPDPQEEINQMLIGIGALAAGIAVTAATADPNLGSNLGQLASSLTEEVGKGIISNPYSRSLELEADQVGLMIMAKSGFNPEDALSFWRRAATDPSFSNQAQFFSTHPIAANRVAKLEEILPRAMEVYRNPNSLAVGIPGQETQNGSPAKQLPKIQTPTNGSSVPEVIRTATPTTSFTERWRTVEKATVHEQPSSSSRTLAELNPGTEIEVTSTLRDGWLEISAPQSGFIRGVNAEPMN